MNATQDPKHNAMPPDQTPKTRQSSAETQRRYRLRIQAEAKAYREIRDIVARVEAES